MAHDPRPHNSAAAWDAIWLAEGRRSSRQLMAPIHKRLLEIAAILTRPPWRAVPPPEPLLLELGSGQALLAERAIGAGWAVLAVDISTVACSMARAVGATAIDVDLEDPYALLDILHHGRKIPDACVASELLEHLSDAARSRTIRRLAERRIPLVLSVPDARLGPDEEPQHGIAYSESSLREQLTHWYDVVEVTPDEQSGKLIAWGAVR